jgi:hypothetical protein
VALFYVKILLATDGPPHKDSVMKSDIPDIIRMLCEVLLSAILAILLSIVLILCFRELVNTV